MSRDSTLKFDKWKRFSENYKPIRVWLRLVYKLFRIIGARNFSSSFYLPWQNEYSNLKTKHLITATAALSY